MHSCKRQQAEFLAQSRRLRSSRDPCSTRTPASIPYSYDRKARRVEQQYERMVIVEGVVPTLRVVVESLRDETSSSCNARGQRRQINTSSASSMAHTQVARAVVAPTQACRAESPKTLTSARHLGVLVHIRARRTPMISKFAVGLFFRFGQKHLLAAAPHNTRSCQLTC